MPPFTRTLYARWGDMDFNGHMKNTAYLDACGDVRMMFFAAHGFPMREFEARRFGPVILRDDLAYFRELRLLEPYSVTLAVAGLSEDGSHFHLRNEFFREDGKKVAAVTSVGGWLDLASRKMMAAPPELAEAMDQLERTDDFAVLESRVRG